MVTRPFKVALLALALLGIANAQADSGDGEAASAPSPPQETGDIELKVEGVGSVVCRPNQEPADVVLAFSRQAAEIGVPMNTENMETFYSYFCTRRACKKPLLNQTVELAMDVGKLRCPPWREPASLVEEFSQRLSASQVPVDSQSMNQMIQYFCERVPCLRNIAPPIRLELQDIGALTVNPWQDPADAVENFANQAITAGIEMDGEGMKQMMEYFCSRRRCIRKELNVPKLPDAMTLNVTGVGSVTVAPLQDPADVIEAFATQALQAGVEMGGEGMKQMMEYFCSKRPCRRMQIQVPTLPPPLKLKVDGVGSVMCGPRQDPADVVEAFAAQAIKAGFPISGEGMKQMMQYFCSRRPCARMQIAMPQVAQPVTMNIEGVGQVTVNPNQDPADVVEEFTRQALEAGVPMTGDAMKQMMEYFCSRRKCERMGLSMPAGAATAAAGGEPISLEIEGVGRLTVRPHQDPADAVENFARQAMEAGVPMTGDGMKQMMEYFCSRRRCQRMQISLPQVAAAGGGGYGAGLPQTPPQTYQPVPPSGNGGGGGIQYGGEPERFTESDEDEAIDLDEPLDLGGDLVDEPLDLSDLA
jgi:hypothetical protein